MTSAKYQVGECELDCKLMSLNYQTQSIKLSSKVYQLLLLFINNPDNIVSRQQATDSLWLGNEAVGKKGFTNAIWVIRKAFKELGVEDEVFNTLPKLGYQLTLTVKLAEPSTTKRSINQKQIVLIALSLLFIGIIGFFFLQSTAKEVTNKPAAVTTDIFKTSKIKVTNYEGVEEHLSVSHDGTKLAMQWRTENLTGKIYIKDLISVDAPLTLISFENNEEASPSWSVSDEKLAYVRINQSGECQVRVRNLVNNTDSLIASDCFYLPYKRVVSWSSVDDDLLVYAKQNEDSVALVSYNLTTGHSKQLTFPNRNEIDYAPKWLAADSKIAYIRESGTATVANLILQNRHGEVKTLIANNASIVDFDYSTKNDLFYVNNVDGASAIISRIRSDGTRLAPIRNASLPSSITQSDINDQLYITEHISKEYITQQSYNGDGIIRRISSSSRDMYARYSTTNDDILFMSNRSKLWSVWKNNQVSSKNLTKNLGNVTVPAISPVNTDFAVNITDNGRSSLFLGDINSENFSAIDINGLEADNLSWSKDGEYLYFKGSSHDQVGIYKLHVNSGELESIIQNNAVYAVEGEKSSVIYLSKFNENGIWRYDQVTGELVQVTDKLAKFDFGSFYYEQGYLYYISRQSKLDIIERIAVTNTSEVQIIKQFPANSVRKFFGLSSADNQSFLATLKVANEADIFGYSLVENQN
ncbi:winged helix-turn-helix domain-containing protein [Shewanella sp. 10N.286.54.B9]|uniref:winged helix-turn-helix domain-containing protein n=1 Tax=Shewanella sp. 10N.286.54.B9 TaxID=3229719 RepID=UPI00354C865A